MFILIKKVNYLYIDILIYVYIYIFIYLHIANFINIFDITIFYKMS